MFSDQAKKFTGASLYVLANCVVVYVGLVVARNLLPLWAFLIVAILAIALTDMKNANDSLSMAIAATLVLLFTLHVFHVTHEGFVLIFGTLGSWIGLLCGIAACERECDNKESEADDSSSS